MSFLANVNSRSRSLYAIARPSVVCLSSVVFVRPTQLVEIFGNISTIDQEFEFYEFFSFLKYEEFYEFFGWKNRKKIVILQIVDV